LRTRQGTDVATGDGRKARTGRVSRIRRRPAIEQFGTLIFFALFYVVIAILKGHQFTSWSNISLVLSQNSYAAILAAAVTLPLIAGQFDLSVGACAGLAAVLCAYFVANARMNVILAVAVTVFVGASVGLVNGVLVTRAKINAFIATLGVSGALGGIATWVSGGQTIYTGIPASLLSTGTRKVLSIPLPIVYVAVATVVLWALTKRTVAGRYWYACGGNSESARLAGVHVRKMVVWAFVGTGVIASIGGILYMVIFASADPTTGPDLLLPAFAGAFLGSSILSDGRFTMTGSVLGTLLLAYATSGLEIAGVNFAAQPIFNALVLVGSVGLTEFLRRRRKVGRVVQV
jgi:ribose transport system permease protein